MLVIVSFVYSSIYRSVNVAQQRQSIKVQSYQTLNALIVKDPLGELVNAM